MYTIPSDLPALPLLGKMSLARQMSLILFYRLLLIIRRSLQRYVNIYYRKVHCQWFDSVFGSIVPTSDIVGEVFATHSNTGDFTLSLPGVPS